MCKPDAVNGATPTKTTTKVKELKAARAAAEATAIKGKPLELVVADESGNPRKASTVSAASMSTQSMMRGILNPRNPTEAELGMWWMFLRDVVRSSMGIVSAEIWQDVDDSAGVVLKRIAYYTDPNYEAYSASETSYGVLTSRLRSLPVSVLKALKTVTWGAERPWATSVRYSISMSAP